VSLFQRPDTNRKRIFGVATKNDKNAREPMLRRNGIRAIRLHAPCVTRQIGKRALAGADIRIRG